MQFLSDYVSKIMFRSVLYHNFDSVFSYENPVLRECNIDNDNIILNEVLITLYITLCIFLSFDATCVPGVEIVYISDKVVACLYVK